MCIARFLSMRTKIINLKDKIFLFLFLIGWTTISYSVFKINEIRLDKNSISANSEVKSGMIYKIY